MNYVSSDCHKHWLYIYHYCGGDVHHDGGGGDDHDDDHMMKPQFLVSSRCWR